MAQRKRRTASSSFLYLLSVDSCEKEPKNGEHSPSLISRIVIRIYLGLPTGSLLLGIYLSVTFLFAMEHWRLFFAALLPSHYCWATLPFIVSPFIGSYGASTAISWF
jgi:hypothetical protein